MVQHSTTNHEIKGLILTVNDGSKWVREKEGASTFSITILSIKGTHNDETQHYVTQHNDTQHKGTQHDDIQNNNTQLNILSLKSHCHNEIQHNNTQYRVVL